MSFGIGTISSTLALSLVFAGPPVNTPVPAHGGPPAVQCSSSPDSWRGSSLEPFDELMAELEAALDLLSVGLGKGRADAAAQARVEATLDRLRFRPLEVARGDADAKVKRAMAVLAAAELPHAHARAAAWLDAALARPNPGIVDVSGLGEELEALWRERSTILAAAGTGRLGVLCDVPCRVVVDGHLLGGGGQYALAAGVHDVWVFASSPAGTHADFEIVEFAGSNDGTCMFFPRAGGLALLVEPERWWAAVDYVRRLVAAIDCQDSPTAEFDPTLLASLLGEARDHNRVFSRDERLRELRVDAEFTLARATGDDAPIEAAVQRSTLDVLSLDVRAAGFGSQLEDRYIAGRDRILAGAHGFIDVRCHDPCVATIDQVRVEPGLHRVPVGAHDVLIYDAAGLGVPYDPGPVSVAPDLEARVSFGEPPAPPPAPRLITDDEIKDPENLRRMPPRTRALVFGLGGGLSLFGGVAWGLGIAAGGLERRTNQALQNPMLDPDEIDPINYGLIAGAFGVHLAIAIVMFVLAKPPKPKPKRKPQQTRINPVGLGLSGRF